MDAFLDDLFHRHVAAAFDKQMRLGDFLREAAGSPEWSFDPSNGHLTFGNGVRFQAQILGSQSEIEETWLWAWANDVAALPDNCLTAARAIRDYGTAHEIVQFTTGLATCASFFSEDLESFAGHALSVIAVGLLGYDAYYSAPYEGGVAVLLLKDPRLESTIKTPIGRILTTFPQALNGYPITDHKTALCGYLEHYGFTPIASETEVVVNQAGSRILTAQFDLLGRMTGLTGTVAAD